MDFLTCKRENVIWDFYFYVSFLLVKMNLIENQSSIVDKIVFKSFVTAFKSESNNCPKYIL